MTVLVDGIAEGPVLVLQAPLSFWGGVDPQTGRIIEKRHPQFGMALRGTILLLPAAKGSSSGSSVLAEVLRLGTGPAGIALGKPDAILATGSMVANRLYGVVCPVAVVDPAMAEQLAGLHHARLACSAQGVVVQPASGR